MSKKKGDLVGIDFGLIAHREAEAHLALCYEALNEEGEDVASAPFCGCDDCVIRETLHAVWPIFRWAALKGAPE